MNWKDPAIAKRLAALWAEGHSCSTIARMIGAVSRNSVIGAVRRQGLPFRGYRPGGIVSKHIGNKERSRPQALGAKIARKKAKAGKPFVFGKRPASEAALAKINFDGLPLPPPAEFDVPRVSFNDLNEDGNRHCKWPCLKEVTDVPQTQPMFCGLEPLPGFPYCEGHARRAYMPPQPRDRRLRIPAESNVIPFKEKVAA